MGRPGGAAAIPFPELITEVRHGGCGRLDGNDRRLLVFRWSGMFIGHLRGVSIAMPRSDVSTGFKARHGWADLSVTFAPATGMAPVRLDFWSIDSQIAGGIHHALATAAAQAQGITGRS